MLFFLTAGPAVFRFILPPFKTYREKDNEDPDIVSAGVEAAEDFDDFTGMFKSQ